MDYTKLKGIAVSMELARSGKFIFAIKHLEKENPEITRETAKAAVESFGYGMRSKPPSADQR
jgi:hypothetical protein